MVLQAASELDAARGAWEGAPESTAPSSSSLTSFDLPTQNLPDVYHHHQSSPPTTSSHSQSFVMADRYSFSLTTFSPRFVTVYIL